jgi:hypothetical protein
MYGNEATLSWNRSMSTLDPRSDGVSIDELLDTTLPAALLVAAASWLPVGVLLLGYAIRVLRAALTGDDALPPLDDVRGLGITGLRGAVIVAAFQLPVVGCLGFVFGLWYVVDRGRFYGDALGHVSADPIGFATLTIASPGNSPVVVGGLVLTVAAALVTGYAGTVAVVTFAATDRLATAFDPDTLLAGIRSSRFRRAFLLASVLAFVGTAAAGLVGLVPVVGPFVAAFVELLALVGALRVVADGYDPRIADTPCPIPETSVEADVDSDAPA